MWTSIRLELIPAQDAVDTVSKVLNLHFELSLFLPSHQSNKLSTKPNTTNTASIYTTYVMSIVAVTLITFPLCLHDNRLDQYLLAL